MPTPAALNLLLTAEIVSVKAGEHKEPFRRSWQMPLVKRSQPWSRYKPDEEGLRLTRGFAR